MQAEVEIEKLQKRNYLIVAVTAVLAIGLYYILPYKPIENKGLALLFFVAVLWFTEAVHLTVTAVLIPVLAVLIGMVSKDAKTGSLVAINIKSALVAFANPVIFLFFGGFALATALHIQKLDKKIAMWMISLSKQNLAVAVIAICAVTAFLSMWISNTATAAMMLPLALGILTHLDVTEDRPTFVFVLLAIAYSASLGGLGTIVGSPPNAIAAQSLDMEFFEWMKIGIPAVLMLLPTMFVVLYIVIRPNLNRKIEIKHEDIPWTNKRIMTLVVFVVVALLWIFGKPISKAFGIPLSDTLVAVGAIVAVVFLGLSTWSEVSKGTDWGVLLLFGGGLTLSAILKDSGASLVLGQEVARIFGGYSLFVVILAVATFIIFLTEFTSNTASAALLVPVFASIASTMGLPKEMLVMVVGLGASCAFMLPVATPPNAVVFGTGLVKQSEMVKAGFFINLASIAIVTVYIFWLYK